MRKLAWIGALAAALAWTGARAEDPQKKQADAQQDVSEAKAKAQQDVSKAKADANEDVSKAQADAQRKVGNAERKAEDKQADARSDAAKRGGRSSARHPTFGSKDNFEVKGKIASVSSGSITVRRQDLPEAKLNLDPNTKIELDGDHVSASALKPGEDVRASFNLQNDRPIAVEIKAKRSGASTHGASDRGARDRNLADPNAGTRRK
jgi:hypothetical protein